MAVFTPMRWLFLMLVCWFAVFTALPIAFSQEAPAEKKGGVAYAQVSNGTVPDYQKDNPLLRTDMTKTSSFQGKMFETKEFKLKEFNSQKDQPIVINKMFTQTSTVTANKNNWQNKEASPGKGSDLTSKQSTIADKRANLGGEDVSLKMVKGFDGKPEEAKKVSGFNQMLPKGQERYTGPGSPQNATEVEMIKDRLKQANSPDELKKNQLTNDEVQKLLQPRQTMTRAKY